MTWQYIVLILGTLLLVGPGMVYAFKRPGAGRSLVIWLAIFTALVWSYTQWGPKDEAAPVRAPIGIQPPPGAAVPPKDNPPMPFGLPGKPGDTPNDSGPNVKQI